MHSALRLYFDWSSRSLYVFYDEEYLIRSVWKKCRNTHALVLCLEWSIGHFKSAPEIACNIEDSHLKASCFSSPDVSTGQPAIQPPGCPVCFRGLSPRWGTEDRTPWPGFRGLNRDIWCHLGCSGQPRSLARAGREQQTPAPFQFPGRARCRASGDPAYCSGGSWIPNIISLCNAQWENLWQSEEEQLKGQMGKGLCKLVLS